jgi:hypothetical protein
MSAEKQNIRAFNWLTLKVLNDLYDAFPEPIDIEGLHFTLATLFDVGPKSKEAGYLSFFSATVRWLNAEGFLRYRSDDGGDFRGVVLSMRGLTALGYEPRSLSRFGRKEPMIDKIKRILSKSAEDISTDAMKALIVKLFLIGVSGGTAGAA